MNIDDFAVGMQFKRIDIEMLISSGNMSNKLRARLVDLKKKSTVDDVILYYMSEQQAWDAGMGSEGYVLLRNNEIIDSLVLRMN